MLVRKTISTFYYSLENSLRKMEFQNTTLLSYKFYASLFAKELFSKTMYKVYNTKNVFENEFQNIIFM
jgi:hypothetical protein